MCGGGGWKELMMKAVDGMFIKAVVYIAVLF